MQHLPFYRIPRAPLRTDLAATFLGQISDRKHKRNINAAGNDIKQSHTHRRVYVLRCRVLGMRASDPAKIPDCRVSAFRIGGRRKRRIKKCFSRRFRSRPICTTRILYHKFLFQSSKSEPLADIVKFSKEKRRIDDTEYCTEKNTPQRWRNTFKNQKKRSARAENNSVRAERFSAEYTVGNICMKYLKGVLKQCFVNTQTV